MVDRENRAKVGISINYLSQNYDIHDMIRGASKAEGLGFDAVWVHDAPLGRRTLAAWSQVDILSAIANETENIKLCSGILQPHLQNPISLAQQWSTVDEISGGRSIFGVGSGAGVGRLVDRQYQMITALGDDNSDYYYKRRRKLWEESVEVIRKLWKNDKISYEGDCFQFEDVTLGKARPSDSPPILMAQGIYFPEEKGGPVHHSWDEERAGQYVIGPAERVARLGDGWITPHATPEEYAEYWEKIKTALENNNRDPDDFTRAYNCFVNIHPNREKAVKNVQSYLEEFHGPPIHMDVAERWSAAGPPETIVEELNEYIEQGVDLFQCVIAADDQFKHMEKFSEEVLPHL
jgi:coenzyme F420-dependent glucose-6-phosphate dehydrogenase